MYRTYVIKLCDGGQHRTHYLSRLPSKHNSPEYTYDYSNAIKATYDEAQKYMGILRKFYDDHVFEKLQVAPTIPENIVYSGYCQAFLAWADIHRHDQLMSLVVEFINDGALIQPKGGL